MHPFRFGALETFAGSGKEWAETARRVEGTGFSTLQIVDHLARQLSPLPALTAAADATTTLRVGTQVCCNDYRHPVMLARECATLDLLSDGRLEIGVGAGWTADDYRRAGLPFESPKVRIDRLEEAVQILKGCFTGEPFSFSGTHYEIAEYSGFPKPVQQPRPPLLIGGGSRRMLTLAGREADIVSINFDMRSDATRRPGAPVAGGIVTAEVARTGTSNAVTEKVDWVRGGAGERFDQLELNITEYVTIVTDAYQTAADDVGNRLGVSGEFVLDLPFALIGGPERLADVLIERRERFGVSYITFPMPIIADAYERLAPLVQKLSGT